MSYKTEQEQFWAGAFGDDYIERNKSKEYLASNVSFFSKALSRLGNTNSFIEFGANIGLNLEAIKVLFPNAKPLAGIEINSKAAERLSEVVGEDNVFNESFLDFKPLQKYDLAFVKGVLIHINPDMLPSAYEKLYEVAKKYILIAEYYNPTPVTLQYRGHSNRLFKRDFAGEMLKQYPDLQLIDYGFVYHRDNNHPQDDVTWFLLEKVG